MEFKNNKLFSAPLRLPAHIRARARQIGRDVGISESHVYRQILEDFFSLNRQITIDKVSIKSDKGERDE